MNDHIPARSVWTALGASLMMAAMGAAVKSAAPLLGNEMVVFLRNAFGLAFLMPGLLRRGPGFLATRRLPAHLGRSLFGLAAMYCFFFAIAHMNLAEAVLLNFSSPLFTAILAALWLKEPLAPKTLAAVFVGLAGIALILKPGGSIWSAAAPVGVVSAILAAVAMLNIRRMGDTEPTYRIVAYFALIGTLVSVVPLLWAWRTPPLAALGYMAAAGMFATVGQLLLTYSYASAPAAKVGTINYSTIVFAALIGWWLWGERPDALAMLGAILICCAGVLVAKRPPAEAD